MSYYNMTVEQMERFGMPEAEPVLRCDKCGRAIYAGNDYYEIGDENYCEDCIYNFKKEAWLS